MGILAFVFVFLLITIVHEFGHFLMAKLNGVRVYEFAVGIGPRIASIVYGDTSYSLNLFPIGGYVRLAGVGGEELEADKNTPTSQLLSNRPAKIRFLVIVMGALFNLLLAWLIVLFLLGFNGVPVGVTNQIDRVIPGSPAAQAGLLPGDKVVKLNGQTIPKMADIIDYIHVNPGKRLTLNIDRNGQEIILSATPKYDPKMRMGLLGFSPKSEIKKLSFLETFLFSFQQMWGLIAMMFYVIFGLITGYFSVGDLAGPVGIAQVTAQSYSMGASSFWAFVAFFNVNVGVLNLLPLPALDGGRLFFIVLEKLRRKPVSIEFETNVHRYGLIFFLVLIVLVTANDLARLFLSR